LHDGGELDFALLFDLRRRSVNRHGLIEE
jgi:hypothetical protein